MIYEFRDMATGEVVERHYRAADVPAVGTIIEADGRTLERIYSTPAGAAVDNFTPFKSVQMPRNHPDAPRVDKRGRAVFHSRAEVREFEAKTKGSGGCEFRY